MVDELLLRHSVKGQDALAALQDLVMTGRNLASSGGGVSPEQYRDAYLQWVETAESELRGLFATRAVWQELYSERYWHLRQLDSHTPRPSKLITMEAGWQVELLEEAIEHLRQQQQAFQLPPECVAIMPDTNVFAHYRRFDQIRWPELADAPSVRLVIPLLVLDELDELSYKSRPGGERAARVLRFIRKLLVDHTPGEWVDVRPEVTVQLLLEPPGHQRRTNSDDEFLSRAEYLSAVVGRRLKVSTGDYGMQVRGISRGLDCIELPSEFRQGAG